MVMVKYLVSANEMACFGSCDGSYLLQPRPVNHDLGSKPFFFHYNKFEGKPISHNNGLKAGIFLGIKKLFFSMKIHSNFNGKQNVCRKPQNGFLAAHSKIFSWGFGPIPLWNNMLGVIHQQPARFQQIQAIGPGQGLRNHRFEPWNGVVWARE